MIEILNYEQADKNKIIGYVDIKFTINKPTTFILRKIAHLNNNGKKWVNLPSFPKGEADTGLSKYFRYCEFSDAQLTNKFLEILHQELNKYIEKNQLEKKEEFPLPNEEDIPF